MPSWQYTTVSMSMYEIGKFIVCKFTVHCVVYSKLLSLTSLQVYSTSDSLQQIVGTYKSLTNQWAITLFHCWQSVFQPIRELLHFCTVAQPIRELLHLFTVAQPISELLPFFHCWIVQEQHYMAFIWLLLMELNYGLWYSHMINHIILLPLVLTAIQLSTTFGPVRVSSTQKMPSSALLLVGSGIPVAFHCHGMVEPKHSHGEGLTALML